jgi:hypothetical protein
MDLITEQELSEMKEGTYTGTVNPACRIMKLIPVEERNKYKGQSSAVNEAFKVLERFCVKGKDKRGINRPSNIAGQATTIAKHIETIREAGLGKYFYQPDAGNNMKPVGNNMTSVGNNMTSVGNNMKPVGNNTTNVKGKLMSAIGDPKSEEGQKKLVAIRDYIQFWKEAGEEEKQKNDVNNSDIQKLNKILTYIEGEIKSNTPAKNNSYPDSEWHPVIEAIWKNIPGNSTNVTAPPAHNNTNNNLNKAQNALNMPVENKKGNNNFNKPQNALNMPVENKKGNNNFNKPQNALNMPVEKNNVTNATNVVEKMTNIQNKLKGIVANMASLIKPAEGGKLTKRTKSIKGTKGRKTQKRKITRKQNK